MCHLGQDFLIKHKYPEGWEGEFWHVEENSIHSGGKFTCKGDKKRQCHILH